MRSKGRERYSSPKGGRRGCLCWDTNTYSKKCCDGHYRSQGVGQDRKEIHLDWNGYYVQNCENGHNRHVHIHGIELVVGKTYYLTLENNHNGCYTITETSNSEGIHINSASIAYDDCTDCDDAN